MRYGILIGVLVIILLLFIAEMILTNLMLHPGPRKTEYVYNEEVKSGRLKLDFYDKIDKEQVWIPSQFGYRLSGLVLSDELTKREENKNKVAVVCHGIKCCKYGAIVYAQILMELGFTVVVYDHRNHGDSDKRVTTMGYYEKQDLKTVIDWCYERFGKDIRIVTQGESMGAATVLSHLAIDDRIAATIADCAYSDLTDLERYQMKTFFHLPTHVLLPLSNVFLKVRAGFTNKDVSPEIGAINSKTPILFIHGDADDYVPTRMSVEMYEKRTGPKEIYLAKGAKHAVSCVVDYDKYKEVVTNFINKYYK